MRWITWYEALFFCRWLTELWRERLPAGCVVTLPSEVEWEKGARGGLLIPAPGAAHIRAAADADFAPAPGAPALEENPLPRRRYPWGDDFDAGKANTEEGGVGETNAVGAFPRGETPYGCLEMSGNVWEWTRSHWQVYSYQLNGKREDLAAGATVPRVLRGGAYYANNACARCSFRLRRYPYNHSRYDGVRLAVSPFPFDLCPFGL